MRAAKCFPFTALALGLLGAGAMVACSHKASKPDIAELYSSSFSGAIALPSLELTTPHFLSPLVITDPIVVYVMDGVDVDAGFQASVAIQPLTERTTPPHCGVEVGKEAERSEETPAPNVTLRRCHAKDGEAATVIDQRFDGAWQGAPFFCVASWHWSGKGELPDSWRKIALSIENTCKTLKVKPQI